ncbi:hypothetical protein LB505_010083 [Fusarium chuoi]|nr:hypothetical protein LB505_010083 [Fusarium chuoi]
MLVDWANPTLAQVLNDTTDFETDDAVIELSDGNQWVYFVIETTLPVPHPIHLHGHDFFILAQGTGWHTSEGFALQFLERSSEIADISTSSYVSDVCDGWSTFQSESSIEQEDSGV